MVWKGLLSGSKLARASRIVGMHSVVYKIWPKNIVLHELGERLAEVMLKRPQFIAPVLAVLEQYEFAVRRISVQLLSVHMFTILVPNREVVTTTLRAFTSTFPIATNAYDNAFSIHIDIVGSESIDS
ncbi:unnamed protein product, partial [Mesorhabditis belari]|uniref:Uncharacterized protein n=1 Tax=Mesorhabditis belari TaxID=2138241 RepID=A0AAF3F9L5_9BILA